MKFLIGSVERVIDKNTYKIRAKVDEVGLVECYATRVENEPSVGDEILVMLFDSTLGSFGIYLPMKVLAEDFIGFAHAGSKLEITQGGNIVISNKSGAKVEMNGSKILAKSGGSEVTISGGKLSISSTLIEVKAAPPTPGANGNFNCIPSCPILGIPHGVNKVLG